MLGRCSMGPKDSQMGKEDAAPSRDKRDHTHFTPFTESRRSGKCHPHEHEEARDPWCSSTAGPAGPMNSAGFGLLLPEMVPKCPWRAPPQRLPCPVSEPPTLHLEYPLQRLHVAAFTLYDGAQDVPPDHLRGQRVQSCAGPRDRKEATETGQGSGPPRATPGTPGPRGLRFPAEPLPTGETLSAQPATESAGPQCRTLLSLCLHTSSHTHPLRMLMEVTRGHEPSLLPDSPWGDLLPGVSVSD